MDNDKDWRTERDSEGFPVANEDRAGDLYTDEYDVTYVCKFVESAGWVWETFYRKE